MKKVLAILLVLGLMLTVAAFADEEKDVTLNLAARWYPTSTNYGGGISYTHHNIWLEGNLFFGKDQRWQVSVEWFGGTKTKWFTGIGNLKATMNSFTGRVGYDVWEKMYLSLDYKSHQHKFSIPGAIVIGNRTYSGIGFGIDKYWKLGDYWQMKTNVHYYPTLSGGNKVDFHDITYEIGFVWKNPKAVNVDFGFRGESWSGFNNANGVNININGPYLGISKDF